MRVKNRILYSVICTMLFVMTFTTLTAFAADGDIVNKTYIGTYYNVDNDNSYFTIKNDSIYPITAIGVYDSERNTYFNGSGDSVGIDSTNFKANFPKIRKADKNGNIIGENWINGSTIEGTVDKEAGWFKLIISVTLKGDGSTYKKN